MQWTVARTSSIFILSIVVLIGAALYSLVAPEKGSVFSNYENTKVSVEGIVVRGIDERETQKRVTVKVQKINNQIVPKSNPLLLISTNQFEEVAYGDRINAVGKIRKPEAFETDTGRTFNYQKFLTAHGISHSMSFANVRIVSRGEGNMVVATLLKTKQFFIRGIERALPEPHAALAAGLLLGEKQSLGATLTDAFRTSGLIHIIVLSGYNVALVINAVLFIVLRFLPRTFAYLFAAVFVIGFVIITGASETTVRAAIMALLMMTARVLHRPADALNGLAIAAAAMAVWNPFIVLYDLSFQLSVFATFGLVMFSSGIAKRLQFITERLGLREIVSTTLATQITVLPLLIYSIGMVSLVFLPANVLVLPAVPIAMLLSFIAALAVLIIPALGMSIGFFAYGILHYIIFIAEFFGLFPQATIAIPESAAMPVLLGLLLVYVFVAVWLTRRNVLK